MPYANIYYIKLQLEILNDKRFIFDLTSDQKWLFIGLLLLAGSTKNSIPDDEKYLKNRLNMPENDSKIRENISILLAKFPKLVSKDGILKFKNFNKLHNPIREIQRDTNGHPMVAIDREIVEICRKRYIELKGYDFKNLDSDFYGRTGKAIKNLVFKAKGEVDLVLAGLDWISKQSYEWTLETLIKKWADFMKVKDTPEILKKWVKKDK
jgi:hypothetical protein